MRVDHKFETFEAFLQAASGKTDLPTNERSSRDKRMGNWHGTTSWTQCLELATKGWPEGAANVRRLNADIVALVATNLLRPAIRYEVCGDTIDMGRFMVGEPECFMEWHDDSATTTGNKVVRIVMNLCVSGAVSTRVIEMRGAAVCALVEALELSGRRCEVVAAISHTGRYDSTNRFETIVTIKEAGQPLEMDRLAFMICQPSMLRRLHFSLMECGSKLQRDVFGAHHGGGYGMPADADSVTGDYVLGSAHWQDQAWRSIQGAKAWVLAALKAQGVQLIEAA